MCYNKAYNLPVLLIGENIPLIGYASYEMFLHIFHAFIEPQLIMATCWSSQEVWLLSGSVHFKLRMLTDHSINCNQSVVSESS